VLEDGVIEEDWDKTEDEFDKEVGDNKDEGKEKTRDVVSRKPVKLVRWYDRHIKVWIVDKRIKKKKVVRHWCIYWVGV
jgi:hypothetical protein